MTIVIIGAGASGLLAEERVRAGVAALAAHDAIALRATSALHENPAIGGVTTARFVNACVVVETALHPRALLDALRAIETHVGRVRGPKDGARALDLDVVWGLDLVGTTRDPDVPHPRALSRDFVVLPALEALARAGLPPPAAFAAAAPRLRATARLAPLLIVTGLFAAGPTTAQPTDAGAVSAPATDGGAIDTPTGDDAVTAVARRTGKSVVRLGIYVGEEQRGNGTGFFVREDGIVITNHHVVDEVRGELVAVTSGGQKLAVVGSLALDPLHDLAVLKVEGNGHPPLALADGAGVQVGQRAMLVGSAYGLDQTVGIGIVSAVRPDGFPPEYLQQVAKSRRKRDPVVGPLLQHTVTAAGGASGSPIVDLQGRVIGVHHSGYDDSEINFGAHVDALRDLLAKTDLTADPRPLGVSRAQNLMISGVVLAGIVAAFVVVPRLLRFLRARRRAPRPIVH